MFYYFFFFSCTLWSFMALFTYSMQSALVISLWLSMARLVHSTLIWVRKQSHNWFLRVLFQYFISYFRKNKNCPVVMTNIYCICRDSPHGLILIVLFLFNFNSVNLLQSVVGHIYAGQGLSRDRPTLKTRSPFP